MQPTHRPVSLALATALFITVGTVHADPLQGASSAYNLRSTLQLLPIAPVNQTAGLAPAPFDLENTVIALDLSNLDPLLSLTTGVLQTGASSDADGVEDFLSRSADAFSLIDGLSLGLLGKSVELGLGAVRSDASVTGTSGNFVASGSSFLASVGLDTFLTLPLNISVWDNLAPNTKLIDNLLGITLTFNEQIVNCGDDFCEITVNALNLGFDNVILGVGNLLGLNGNLIIGQSYASLGTLAPIPEADSWAMLLAGLGLVGWRLRRRA